MGYTKKSEDDNKNNNSSSSLNESLLIATMCLIGLQVHVHVKDASVFSGIFYTASLDNGFGIVLKNAKITKKGASKVNVASGSVVDTLVILSSDIVQIVAEGVSLPSNVTGNNEVENVESATECIANNSTRKIIEERGKNHRRQAGAKTLNRGEQISYVHHADNVNIQSSSSSLDSMSEQVKPMEDRLLLEPLSNGFQDAAEQPSSTEDSSSQSTNVDETSELCQGLVASSYPSLPTQAVKKPKEFKLNPEAKIFSPSYTKPLSPSHGISDAGNIAYIPNNTPMILVPEAGYPEVGNYPYMPQASPPSKFVPYGNLTAGNAVGGLHFPQHMIGPTINRAQPQRFTPQYQSVQASPMFVNPNPQVMVGRSGQLVYIQPGTQDLVPGMAHMSPVLPRPLPTAQHVQYLKHQGVVAAGQPIQLCVSQPFMAGGMQPYGIPTQFPVMQPPFPTNQPMQVAAPSGYFGTKFL